MADTINMEHMLPEGAQLQNGKYVVNRRIASGGFGNTYEVTNVELEERMALKEFFIRGVNERDDGKTTVSVSNKDNQSQFDSQREKFRKEARRLYKLHNAHIVRVHDLFEENGTVYYTMDFIDGESLSTRIKRTGTPLTEGEAMKVLGQVLDALQAVHAEGIYHLDLKPANIMLDKKGTVWLIDFGASKQMAISDGYSTTTAMCYTMGYAPMEQMDHQMDQVGAWTDLYALGATLYNLLTGKTPPLVSNLLQLQTNAFSFPTDVSPRIRHLIKWMMEPRKQDRPQSVEQVRQFLTKPFIAPQPQLSEETVYSPSPKVPKGPSTRWDNPKPTNKHSKAKGMETPEPKVKPRKTTTQQVMSTAAPVGIAVAGMAVFALAVWLFTPKGSNVNSYGSQSSLSSPAIQPVQHPVATPLCPDGFHPHVIDLGLPSGTKWACCNVGSSKPEDDGGYFAWAETSTKDTYDWSTYRWCNGDFNKLTKYNTLSSCGTVDNKIQLDLYDDAAHANWHRSWRMPTIAECQELIDNCSYEWTTVNGIKGGKFTSRSNGRSVFLPAAGWRYGTSLGDRGKGGYYWSSSLFGSSPNSAHGLGFNSNWADTGYSRYVGQSIRPVLRN